MLIYFNVVFLLVLLLVLVVVVVLVVFWSFYDILLVSILVFSAFSFARSSVSALDFLFLLFFRFLLFVFFILFFLFRELRMTIDDVCCPGCSGRPGDALYDITWLLPGRTTKTKIIIKCKYIVFQRNEASDWVRPQTARPPITARVVGRDEGLIKHHAW